MVSEKKACTLNCCFQHEGFCCVREFLPCADLDECKVKSEDDLEEMSDAEIEAAEAIGII